jgi:aminoglycoside phosphotransferase (APT) family kinase protein
VTVTEARPDLRNLAEFLRSSIYPDASDVTVERIVRPSGGASWETFFLELAVRSGGEPRPERVVIKRAPATGPMAPYEIRKDVAIFQALADSDVPVPRLLAFTEDPSVFERPFTVTALIEGESHDITKVERWSVWQEERESLGYAIVDVAAALNRFRWQGTDVASVMGAEGSAARRVSWMVDRYLEPLLERSRAIDVPQIFCRDVGAWLKEKVHEIPEHELSVVHGDFRFGNFLFQGTKLVGVVDWERAMLGDPMSNLGFFCMPMSRRVRPDLMGKALLFEQMAERYEQVNRMPLDRPRLQYYMIFWQFFEGVNSARSNTEALLGNGGAVSSSGLASSNLLMRQTLRLIEAYDSGHYDVR